MKIKQAIKPFWCTTIEFYTVTVKIIQAAQAAIED